MPGVNRSNFGKLTILTILIDILDAKMLFTLTKVSLIGTWIYLW